MPYFGEERVETEDTAGDANRLVPAQAQIRDDRAGGVEIHSRRRSTRCLLTEVQERILAIGEMQGSEAAATDIAAAGKDDRERVANCHRCVDRVAALLQNIDPHLRGEVLGRDHHSGASLDRRRRDSVC